MTILQSTTDSQTLNFIPREYTSGTTYTISIKDETTNKEVFSSTATTFTALDYYFQYSSVFTLVENTMYMLEIKDGNNVTFKDKIFDGSTLIIYWKVSVAADVVNPDNP